MLSLSLCLVCVFLLNKLINKTKNRVYTFITSSNSCWHSLILVVQNCFFLKCELALVTDFQEVRYGRVQKGNFLMQNYGNATPARWSWATWAAVKAGQQLVPLMGCGGMALFSVVFLPQTHPIWPLNNNNNNNHTNINTARQIPADEYSEKYLTGTPQHCQGFDIWTVRAIFMAIQCSMQCAAHDPGKERYQSYLNKVRTCQNGFTTCEVN